MKTNIQLIKLGDIVEIDGELYKVTKHNYNETVGMYEIGHLKFPLAANKEFITYASKNLQLEVK